MLCVWFPRWPIQRLVAHERAAGGGGAPRVLVLHAEGRHGRQVTACCREASARGIQPGMTLAEAESLLPSPGPRSTRGARSPARPVPFVSLPADPPADRAALEDMAHAFQKFTPLVGLEDASSPESVWLDLTGCHTQYESEWDFVGRLSRRLLRRGYQPRLALAETYGAAWGLAHFSQPPQPPLDEHLPERARHESETCLHENHLTLIVPPGGIAGLLKPLPLASLRLELPMVKLLNELGVHTVAQLLALPRQSLPVRFGSQILDRVDEALGHRPEVLVPHRPPVPIEVERLFEDAVEDWLSVEAALQDLLEQVAARLMSQGRALSRLEVILPHPPPRPASTLVLGLYQPSLTVSHWRNLLHLQLEKLTCHASICGIRLRVTGMAPRVPAPQTLFGETDSDSDAQLPALIDRLVSRLGHQSLVQPHEVGEALPELARQWTPVLEGSQSPPRAKPKKTPGRRRTRADGSLDTRPLPVLRGPPRTASVLRPLRMGDPQRIEVRVDSSEGPPVSLVWQNQEHAIRRTWGPERIETGWWRGPPQVRDYYRAETATGQHFWIFRDASGEWYWQGAFE